MSTKKTKKEKPSLTKKSEKSDSKVKNKKSKNKPKIKDAKSPDKVKVKNKRKEVDRTPPPTALPAINGVKNPLLENKRCKRALVIAFATLTDDDDLLKRCVRESGVLNYRGITADKMDTGVIQGTNEVTGNGYAIRTGRAMQDWYPGKYVDKMKEVMPFAKAFIKLIKGKEYDKVRKDELKGIGIVEK